MTKKVNAMTTQLVPSKAIDIKKFVSKCRDDIAIANPVYLLIRAMAGEEFDGERLNIRDRVEIAKFLTMRVVPQVTTELVDNVGEKKTPPPLTIIMNGSQQVSVDVVEEKAKVEAVELQNDLKIVNAVIDI